MTYETKVIKSLDDISNNGFPVIVFCDNLRGFLNWGIKARTQGSYSHVMLLLNADGECGSQDFTGFNIIDIKKRYMKDGFRLKFFAVKDLSSIKRNILIKECFIEAKKPWFTRRYDILGIVGQLIGIQKLNNPFRKYCSEDIIARLKSIGISRINAQLNPSELNELCSNDSRFTYLGHWFAD